MTFHILSHMFTSCVYTLDFIELEKRIDISKHIFVLQFNTNIHFWFAGRSLITTQLTLNMIRSWTWFPGLIRGMIRRMIRPGDPGTWDRSAIRISSAVPHTPPVQYSTVQYSTVQCLTLLHLCCDKY